MSQADLTRFIEDLKTNPDLQAKVKEGAGGLDSIVAMAKESGYDVTLQEVKDYLQSQSAKDLSNDEMEALAGGSASPVVAVTSEVAAVVVVATGVPVASTPSEQVEAVVSTAAVATAVVS